MTILCALIIGSAPAVSFAADGDDGAEASARVLFIVGRELAARGDYLAACPKLEESLRLDPGAGTRFNLADCWEHIGRTASAWAQFNEVAAAARAAGEADRESLARDRAAALEPALSRLVVEVTAPEEGLALTVRRDGVAVREAAWRSPVALDPGVYTIEATAPHRKKWSSIVTVPSSGGTVAVSVPALQEEAPASPVAASAPMPRADTAASALSTGQPRRRALSPVLALGAAGILGLAAAAISLAALDSVNRRAETICPSGVGCTKEEGSQHDFLLTRARRDRVFTYAGLGVGAAALVTAALLWSRPPRPASPEGSARARSGVRHLSWVAGPGGAGMAGEW